MSTPAQVWSYRTLIVNLAQRDLKARYKKSFLGWAWSLINPAATLGIYTLVFGVFLKGQAPTAGNGSLNSFALFPFCGLVLWNLFSGVINTSIMSFLNAGGLLTRTYFPPEAPMVKSGGEGWHDLFANLGEYTGDFSAPPTPPNPVLSTFCDMSAAPVAGKPTCTRLLRDGQTGTLYNNIPQVGMVGSSWEGHQYPKTAWPASGLPITFQYGKFGARCVRPADAY